jgi:hypothetical protein
MGEENLERARKALELADEASEQAARLFRIASRMGQRSGSVTVSLEEAIKAAQWASRRAQLAAKEATTLAGAAVSLAFDGSPDSRIQTEAALRSAHHARWLLQAADESVQRARRMRQEMEQASIEASRWSDDADDGEDRQTLIERAAEPLPSQKIPDRHSGE